MKLGRLPHDPSKPRVRLTADLIPAAAYNPPPSVDYYSKVPAQSWGMDANDVYGDCTCAEIDHTIKALQVAAGNTEIQSTDAEVLAIYSAVTGFDPNNPSTDNGANMQDVRRYWQTHGVTLGGRQDKCVLFAQVDHTDLMLVRWAIDRFGSLGVGVNFPDSAMQQFNDNQPWDVVNGARIEGGHAVAAVGYDAQFIYLVSWGRVVQATWAWFVAYCEELWAQLSSDWCNSVSGDDPLGETLWQLGEQFRQVTGQANPFPAPAPVPGPAPSPAPAPAPTLPADVVAWAKRTLQRTHYTLTDKRAARELLTWAGQ